jgi:hypothetical protein
MAPLHSKACKSFKHYEWAGAVGHLNKEELHTFRKFCLNAFKEIVSSLWFPLVLFVKIEYFRGLVRWRVVEQHEFTLRLRNDLKLIIGDVMNVVFQGPLPRPVRYHSPAEETSDEEYNPLEESDEKESDGSDKDGVIPPSTRSGEGKASVLAAIDPSDGEEEEGFGAVDFDAEVIELEDVARYVYRGDEYPDVPADHAVVVEPGLRSDAPDPRGYTENRVWQPYDSGNSFFLGLTETPPFLAELNITMSTYDIAHLSVFFKAHVLKTLVPSLPVEVALQLYNLFRADLFSARSMDNDKSLAENITARWHKLCLSWHPDKLVPPNCTELGLDCRSPGNFEAYRADIGVLLQATYDQALRISKGELNLTRGKTVAFAELIYNRQHGLIHFPGGATFSRPGYQRIPVPPEPRVPVPPEPHQRHSKDEADDEDA